MQDHSRPAIASEAKRRATSGPRDGVVSITEVGLGREQEFKRRRLRYSIMMALRAVCVVLAAVAYSLSPWLALAFIVGGALLPWCAVLLANDGPVKRTPPTRQSPTVIREAALGPATFEPGEDGRTDN